MKTFRSFMNEETMPYANVKSGVMDIADSAVRDQINQLLAGVTSETTVTPYITLEKISKALANFHIILPAQTFFEGDSGNAIWPVSQFGNKFGENDDGQVVTTPPSQYSIYFEYRMADSGMFNVFCELVDQDELDEILDDLESELNDDTEEEEEEEESHIEEASSEKLRRYIRKANDELADTPEEDEESTRKLDNRQKGIRLASMKRNASKYVKVKATNG